MLVSEVYDLIEKELSDESLNPYFVGCWFLSSEKRPFNITGISLNPYFVGCWFLSTH